MHPRETRRDYLTHAIARLRNRLSDMRGEPERHSELELASVQKELADLRASLEDLDGEAST